MPGVYISYPFCSRKCTYCNFASGPQPAELEREYVEALLDEIAAYAWRWRPETVYLGGGSPNRMTPEALRRLLDGVPGRPWIEATIEAAPGEIGRERARLWAASGITRASLGVQSFVPREIIPTGRKYAPETVAADIDELRRAGITRINVDLIAGTSTGGLLALAIGKGESLDTIRDFYVEDGPVIFDDSWIDNLLDLGKLRGADYKISPLRRVLKRILGSDTTLGDLDRHVLITAFDLDNEDPDPEQRCWKPKIFHNFPGPGTDRDHSAYKVGLYTAAAPTYFPTVDGYIDGGVYAANPSMCALAQARDHRYLDPPPALDDIVLLSLGTGHSLNHSRQFGRILLLCGYFCDR